MIESLLLSLTLTLAVELTAALVLGVRKKRDFLLITLVNIITNPVLVQTLNLYSLMLNRMPPWYGILLLEAAAVAVEGFLYKNRLEYKKINPFIFSLILNLLSYFGGSVINEIFRQVL